MERWEEDERQIAALTDKLIAAEARVADFEEAHRRVKESFKHTTGTGCGCPYCTHDVDALAIHAAEQELKWMDAQEVLRSLQARVAELESLQEQPVAVKAMQCKWCAETFTSESQFIDHIQMHVTVGPLVPLEEYDRRQRMMKPMEIFPNDTPEGKAEVRKVLEAYQRITQAREEQWERKKGAF